MVAKVLVEQTWGPGFRSPIPTKSQTCKHPLVTLASEYEKGAFLEIAGKSVQSISELWL